MASSTDKEIAQFVWDGTGTSPVALPWFIGVVARVITQATPLLGAHEKLRIAWTIYKQTPGMTCRNCCVSVYLDAGEKSYTACIADLGEGRLANYVPHCNVYGVGGHRGFSRATDSTEDIIQHAVGEIAAACRELRAKQ